MIWFLDTLCISIKYSTSGGALSHFLPRDHFFLPSPICISLAPMPYGGSTTAKSKNLSGSPAMYSMQSMRYVSDKGIVIQFRPKVSGLFQSSFLPRSLLFWRMSTSMSGCVFLGGFSALRVLALPVPVYAHKSRCFRA